MGKKLIVFIAAFSIFFFSLPQNAAAGLFCSDHSQAGTNAVSSPMKLINMLDISMKMAKICYGAGKEFFSGFYFSDATSAAAGFFDCCKAVLLLASKETLIFRQIENTKFYSKMLSGFGAIADSSRYAPDKFRRHRDSAVNLYLLYIEALHKSSLPASINSTIIKFYNPALGIFPQAGFIFLEI